MGSVRVEKWKVIGDWWGEAPERSNGSNGALEVSLLKEFVRPVDAPSPCPFTTTARRVCSHSSPNSGETPIFPADALRSLGCRPTQLPITNHQSRIRLLRRLRSPEISSQDFDPGRNQRDDDNGQDHERKIVLDVGETTKKVTC